MALGTNLKRLLNPRLLLANWPWLILLAGFALLRFSKGAFLLDLYAQASRPFWPGSAQKEWLQKAQQLEDQQRIALLEAKLQQHSQIQKVRNQPGAWITAAVISRNIQGWWQELLIGAGALQGIRVGAAVTGPGGLLGRISSITPTTAKVLLLGDPSSRVAVELQGKQGQGLLIGDGTSRPRLAFLDKDVEVLPGDVVITSAASTIFPANLIVGVVQKVNFDAIPAPEASIQLTAPIMAVDWVRVR
jgi:rod shape-determining protein MreC